MAQKPQIVALGPLETIVNVGWSAKKILALQIEYEKNFFHPAFKVHGLPFGVASLDPFESVIYETVGEPPFASVENPITPEMLRTLRLWNVPPFKLGTTDNVMSGRCILFFNLPKIRKLLDSSEFKFEIETPGTGGVGGTGGILYYVWNPVGLPFPGVEPYTYGAAIEFDSAWGTAGEASARANNLIPVHDVIADPITVVVNDSLNWKLALSTYKNKTDFPVEEAQALWDPDAESENIVNEGASGTTDNPVEPGMYSIKVDTSLLTIDIEQTQ